MVPHHHASNVLPKNKREGFPHDLTLLTASVMGESVEGHGIGGKEIPIKMG